MCVRGYVYTCVRIYVLLYECVYIHTYVRDPVRLRLRHLYQVEFCSFIVRYPTAGASMHYGHISSWHCHQQQLLILTWSSTTAVDFVIVFNNSCWFWLCSQQQLLIFTTHLPASVAQVDVHPNGDFSVLRNIYIFVYHNIFFVCLCQPWWTGGCKFIPRWVGNILSWKYEHEIFSLVIPSLLLIQEGQFPVFWWKHVHNTGYPLRWLSLSSKANLPCSTWPHLVDLAIKPQHKQQHLLMFYSVINNTC